MGSILIEGRGDPQLSNILDEDSLDPSKHYRFVQERPQRIAAVKRKGYEVVTREVHGVRTLFDNDEDDGTGVIRDGDTVLMQIPLEEHQNNERKRQRTRKTRLASADSRFRELARRTGTRITDKDHSVGTEPKGPGD